MRLHSQLQLDLVLEADSEVLPVSCSIQVRVPVLVLALFRVAWRLRALRVLIYVLSALVWALEAQSRDLNWIWAHLGLSSLSMVAVEDTPRRLRLWALSL